MALSVDRTLTRSRETRECECNGGKTLLNLFIASEPPFTFLTLPSLDPPPPPFHTPPPTPPTLLDGYRAKVGLDLSFEL